MEDQCGSDECVLLPLFPTPERAFDFSISQSNQGASRNFYAIVPRYHISQTNVFVFVNSANPNRSKPHEPKPNQTRPTQSKANQTNLQQGLAPLCGVGD